MWPSSLARFLFVAFDDFLAHKNKLIVLPKNDLEVQQMSEIISLT